MLLASRKIEDCARTNISLKTFLHLIDERCISKFDHAFYILVSCITIAIFQVLFDGTNDKDGLLADVANTLTECLQVDIFQFLLSVLDVASVRVIKAVQHLYDRALTRTGRSDNSCRSTSHDSEIDTRKDIFDVFGCCRVSKLHITELDTMIELNNIFASIFIFDLRHSVNDFENLMA